MVWAEGLEIQFELVWDEERREAHIRSSGGVTSLTALRGDGGETTFFAVSDTGGLTFTTVMPGGEAVHGRHGAHGSQLSASQHYWRVPVRGPQQISPVRAGGESRAWLS